MLWTDIFHLSLKRLLVSVDRVDDPLINFKRGYLPRMQHQYSQLRMES